MQLNVIPYTSRANCGVKRKINKIQATSTTKTITTARSHTVSYTSHKYTHTHTHSISAACLSIEALCTYNNWAKCDAAKRSFFLSSTYNRMHLKKVDICVLCTCDETRAKENRGEKCVWAHSEWTKKMIFYFCVYATGIFSDTGNRRTGCFKWCSRRCRSISLWSYDANRCLNLI